MKEKLSPERKEIINGLIKDGNLTSAEDVQSMLKDLFKDTLQQILEAELTHDLGYGKGAQKPVEVTNRRNGHSTKNVRSEYGEVGLTIPRDREGNFEPQIVKKNQKSVTGIESQIIALYAKGVSTREIQDFLKNLYGIEVSPALISTVTSKLIPQIKEWQNRPLEPVYACAFLDAVHFKVKQEGFIVNKAAYICIGIDLDGVKDVLGIWIGENESSKFWLRVMNELKNRGTKDILITCVDNLNGFSEAIQACYPESEIQKCVVHQIRNSLRYVSYKDKKKVAGELKPIYQAVSEQAGREELEAFGEKWNERYPLIYKSWDSNWEELSTFFKYPPEIRKLIYTTNMIESFHRQLRKVTKAKSLFPHDEALQKSLYLVTQAVTRKWTGRIHHWSQILLQLSVFFPERVESYLK